jgi:hypothetical protein
MDLQQISTHTLEKNCIWFGSKKFGLQFCITLFDMLGTRESDFTSTAIEAFE